MKEHTIFDTIRKAFEPDGIGHALPEGLEISGQEAFFQGNVAKRQDREVCVRDSGPDAWGAQVSFSLPAWYSWDEGKSWYHEEESPYKFLTCVGSSLDLIYVNQEDQLEYVRYLAVEW